MPEAVAFGFVGHLGQNPCRDRLAEQVQNPGRVELSSAHQGLESELPAEGCCQREQLAPGTGERLELVGDREADVRWDVDRSGRLPATTHVAAPELGLRSGRPHFKWAACKERSYNLYDIQRYAFGSCDDRRS